MRVRMCVWVRDDHFHSVTVGSFYFSININIHEHKEWERGEIQPKHDLFIQPTRMMCAQFITFSQRIYLRCISETMESIVEHISGLPRQIFIIKCISALDAIAFHLMAQLKYRFPCASFVFNHFIFLICSIINFVK